MTVAESWAARDAMAQWWADVGTIVAKLVLASLGFVVAYALIREMAHRLVGRRYPGAFRHQWLRWTTMGTRRFKQCTTCGLVETIPMPIEEWETIE